MALQMDTRRYAQEGHPTRQKACGLHLRRPRQTTHKTYQEQTTHFVWDGNVPLHEWTVSIDQSNSVITEDGKKEHTTPENLITWIFEDGTFIPMAKLQGYKSYSIITDHLGTPVESYDEEGKKVWSRELNIYGETRNEFGEENFVPFLYQGQYLDMRKRSLLTTVSVIILLKVERM
jgi:hypothetical protein